MSKIENSLSTPQKPEPPRAKPQPQSGQSQAFRQMQARQARSQETQQLGLMQAQRQHQRTTAQARARIQQAQAERDQSDLFEARRSAGKSAVEEKMEEARTEAEMIALLDELPEDFKDPASGEDGSFAPGENIDLQSLGDELMDMAALVNVLPVDGASGIFEVLLPTGDSLGVVVSDQASGLGYLLSPSSDRLGKRLRDNRMELETRLGRLTHRNVNITVL